MNKEVLRNLAVGLLLLGLSATACSAMAPSQPAVVINSPAHGSRFHSGEQVTVESIATDASGVVRVELLVDGRAIRTAQPPSPQSQFTVNQTWQATPGTHTISVIAYNTAGRASSPAVIQIAAVMSPTPAAAPPLVPTKTPTVIPTPQPTIAFNPTATAVPTPACTNHAVFVADVTVPDGTMLAAGQPFNKIWRVRNIGTCAWGIGYRFVFVGGAAMATIESIAVPPTAPGVTADLLVPMSAPVASGTRTSFWRLQDPNGIRFGDTLWVKIRVPAPPAPAPTIVPTPIPTETPTPSAHGCVGTPIIEFFTATPTTITEGESATLYWGLVGNADVAAIDNGIGGVATPGSTTVSPRTTTTYTLVGTCGTNVETSEVTITVNPGP